MITPERGKLYLVKHSSGLIKARFIEERNIEGWKSPVSNYARRASTHYIFQNLNSGRDIEIKSRVKIRQEIAA